MLAVLSGQAGAVGYHRTTRRRSLPGEEAIAEEEREAIPTAACEPLDPAIPEASHLSTLVP